MTNVIPPMVHPLSRAWAQPPAERIAIDDAHALMDQRTFAELPEYSTTYPSGVYAGKMWKRQEYIRFADNVVRMTGRWFLCWYSDAKDPAQCEVNYRTVLLV